MIFTKQPWTPSKKNTRRPRYTELQRVSVRKVWNDKKMDVETIEDIPRVDSAHLDMLSKQMTETYSPNISICQK